MIATFFLLGSMLFQTAASAPTPEILTNASVVSLVEAGIRADTVIEKIKRSPCRFSTDTQALVDLAKHKVPDSILQVMLAAPVADSPAASAPVAVVAPVVAATPPSAPRMAVVRDIEWSDSKSVPCLGVLALTYEGFEFQPAVGGCSEPLRVPWTAVKEYCFMPSRVLGGAEIGFRGKVKGTKWGFNSTTKEAGADLTTAVQSLRKSSVDVMETCQ